MSDKAKRDKTLHVFSQPLHVILQTAEDGAHMLVFKESDEIALLRAENATLRAAVERVLALHEVFGDWCDRCNCVAPCATIRALEGTP